MSKDLKYYFDNFDTDTLDSLEMGHYLELLETNTKRTALLKMICYYDVRSYYLTELKDCLEQLETRLDEIQ